MHQPALPAALGADRPVTYLVLVQTDVELRATGGFITSAGTIRLEGGAPTALAFEKVYAAEGIGVPGPDTSTAGGYLQPPAPLSRYMGLGQWRLRDANWSDVAQNVALFLSGLANPPGPVVTHFASFFASPLLAAPGRWSSSTAP